MPRCSTPTSNERDYRRVPLACNARFGCFATPPSKPIMTTPGPSGRRSARTNFGRTRRATDSVMRRGEIWQVDFDPARGSEANKHRPAVIVSNDRANATAARLGRGVVTVVPVTSNIATIYPFQVLLAAPTTGLTVDSKAQAEQIRSVATQPGIVIVAACEDFASIGYHLPVFCKVELSPRRPNPKPPRSADIMAHPCRATPGRVRDGVQAGLPSRADRTAARLPGYAHRAPSSSQLFAEGCRDLTRPAALRECSADRARRRR